MKKFIYIGILFLAVALASCSKDAFKIQNDDERKIPQWECGTKGISSQNGDTLNPDILDDEDADQGGITDPNNDPDGRKKKP